MSLPTVAPEEIVTGGAPKTPIQDLAERSGSGDLLLRRAVGVCIDFIVLFLFLLIPDAALGNELYQKTIWLWLGALALYFVLGEGLWGRTVGKLIMGTVVVDAAGQAPGILKPWRGRSCALSRSIRLPLPSRRHRIRRLDAAAASRRHAGERPMSCTRSI